MANKRGPVLTAADRVHRLGGISWDVFELGRARQGDWVKINGEIAGRFVGRTPAGVDWVFYLGRGDANDYGEMCSRFDRVTARQRKARERDD